MATVPANLNKIKTAIYGEEVRDAIYNGIAECYNYANGNTIDGLMPFSVNNLMAFAENLKEINVVFDNENNTIKSDNTFLVILGQDTTKAYVKAFRIQPFEFTILNYQMIYVRKEDLKRPSEDNSDTVNIVPEVDYYYASSWYSYEDIIPLFWRSGDSISNSLGIDINNEFVKNVKPKNAVWFGDSISALKNLPDKVSSIIGFTVYDVSIPGSVLYKHHGNNYEKLGFYTLIDSLYNDDFTIPEEAAASLDISTPTSIGNKNETRTVRISRLKSIEFNTIDYLIFFYGANDFYASDCTIDEYKNAMEQSLIKLFSKYPNLKIYCIGPIFRGDGNTENSKGLIMEDYSNGEKEISNKLAIQFVDMYHECQINEYNKGYYLNSDELHPSTAGNELLAQKIAKFLISK